MNKALENYNKDYLIRLIRTQFAIMDHQGTVINELTMRCWQMENEQDLKRISEISEIAAKIAECIHDSYDLATAWENEDFDTIIEIGRKYLK